VIFNIQNQAKAEDNQVKGEIPKTHDLSNPKLGKAVKKIKSRLETKH
jgi:hypothetical protein